MTRFTVTLQHTRPTEVINVEQTSDIHFDFETQLEAITAFRAPAETFSKLAEDRSVCTLNRLVGMREGKRIHSTIMYRVLD